MDIFTRYERPKAVNAEEVTAWLGIFEKLIGTLNTESVSTAEYESKIRKQYEDTPKSEALIEAFDAFQTALFSVIDSSPSDAVHAYNMLGDLRSTVKDERDYHVKHEARMTKPKATVGEEFQSTKDDATAIKDHVENLFNLSTMGMFEWPEDVKVKTLKDGSTKPDLPRIPSGPREGAGRTAANSKLRLTVDGKFYPDWTVAKVCHDVLSDGPSRVSVSTLIEHVESKGHKFSEGWTEPVGINGMNVTGAVLAKTEGDDTDEDMPEDDE